MKALVLLAAAVMASGASAMVGPQGPLPVQQEIKLAGNPNVGPNGTNVNSQGKSGAPGGSWGAPGQTPNPNPGK